MTIKLHRWLLLISLSTTVATENPRLPPCPIHVQHFPQDLPMHCRMPRNADPGAFPELPQYPTLPPLPESYFQSPPPNELPPPVPVPIPPFPGIPGGMPMPGPMGPHMGGPMPGLMPGMPGPMPMPMPIMGGPAHKLPVIVMPFYSPDNSFKKGPPQNRHRKRPNKKKRKKKPSHDSDTDVSSDEECSEGDDSHNSDEHGFWKGRRKLSRRKLTRRFNKRQKMRKQESRDYKKEDLLTPILQYVTKDGYVIFEKQITKSEAKDWLKPNREVNVVEENREEKDDENKQRSAEDSLKVDVEEIPIEAEDKSKETPTVEVKPKKGIKQYPKKVNSLTKRMSIPQS